MQLNAMLYNAMQQDRIAAPHLSLAGKTMIVFGLVIMSTNMVVEIPVNWFL